MTDLNRHKKTELKWQGIAESFGYNSEKEFYISEYKDKDTRRIAEMINCSAQTIRYRIMKCGISLYTGQPLPICALCEIRPCTWPNKRLCDHCMQTDIEPGYENWG